ncbi:NRDE family protein [Mangrovimonas sp. CR14]|uniref:NRDE family protein n=1 Tax=Mangrovimonas sp. CR14 TaxID=2706120 RepID=UPI00141EC15E|nr:NRDE family protein [Mangrovimonas sp. CR14]NIK91320.1 NRDE family protein [Mangrovimonas sp. CR14]
MCTVTLVAIGDSGFVLTSNRDEDPQRETIAPKIYFKEGVTIWCPKDKVAGGTWIGLSDKQRVICLLNGGFTRHKRLDKYKMSRGVVVKELLIADNFLNCISKFDFSHIEPFTIVAADWNDSLCFFEIVWDGLEVHQKELELKTHIWSSTTLYDEQMKSERHQWFKEFKEGHSLNEKSLLKFHKTYNLNKEYGIIMDRGFVKTTSITQIVMKKEEIKTKFLNLQEEDSMVHEIFSKTNFIHE